MDRLAGRIALVTGAASGIGAATALRLASEGAAVLVTDVQDDSGAHVLKEIIAGGGRAAYAHLDVTSQDQWQAAVAGAIQEFGGLDILVNNAGMLDLAGIEETSLADWRRTIEIDQTGVFLGMRAAAAALATSGHGSVINISSVFGASGGFGTSPAYHAAKGAVRTLTPLMQACPGHISARYRRSADHLRVLPEGRRTADISAHGGEVRLR